MGESLFALQATEMVGGGTIQKAIWTARRNVEGIENA